MRRETTALPMRLEDLDLPPLVCSLGSELGDYYQDFLPAISIVESGYHGSLDPEGIPLVHYPGQGEVYNSITVAQYALANLRAVLLGDESRRPLARRLCDWLVETQEGGTGPRSGLWTQAFDNPKYPWLKAGWVSAMAQGNAISALLRGYEILGEGRGYASSARAAYDGLHNDDLDPAIWHEASETIWYEEYPADPPLHVLNGHVYALLGVVDAARTRLAPSAEGRWRKAVAAVKESLASFDTGFWSVYDLRDREPVSLHYHKNIHIPQLRILGELTGDPAFHQAAEGWARYLNSPWARVRRWFSARLHRHGRGRRSSGSHRGKG